MIATTTRYGWATNEYGSTVRVFRTLAITRCPHCGHPLEAGSLITHHETRRHRKPLLCCRQCVRFVVIRLERKAA